MKKEIKKEILEEFHKKWKAEMFTLGDFYKGEAMPKIDSWIEETIDKVAEEERREERERIIKYCTHDLQKDWETEKEYNEALVDVVNYLKSLTDNQ